MGMGMTMAMEREEREESGRINLIRIRSEPEPEREPEPYQPEPYHHHLHHLSTACPPTTSTTAMALHSFPPFPAHSRIDHLDPPLGVHHTHSPSSASSFASSTLSSITTNTDSGEQDTSPSSPPSLLNDTSPSLPQTPSSANSHFRLDLHSTDFSAALKQHQLHYTHPTAIDDHLLTSALFALFLAQRSPVLKACIPSLLTIPIGIGHHFHFLPDTLLPSSSFSISLLTPPRSWPPFSHRPLSTSQPPSGRLPPTSAGLDSVKKTSFGSYTNITNRSVPVDNPPPVPRPLTLICLTSLRPSPPSPRSLPPSALQSYQPSKTISSPSTSFAGSISQNPSRYVPFAAPISFACQLT